MWNQAPDGTWHYVPFVRQTQTKNVTFAILTVLTCGLFLPVWGLIAVFEAIDKRR